MQNAMTFMSQHTPPLKLCEAAMKCECTYLYMYQCHHARKAKAYLDAE